MKSSEKLTIFGLATGLVVGAVLGLVFAPGSGAKTRGRLSHRVNWVLWTPEERYLHLLRKTRRGGSRVARDL